MVPKKYLSKIWSKKDDVQTKKPAMESNKIVLATKRDSSMLKEQRIRYPVFSSIERCIFEDWWIEALKNWICVP